MLGRKAQVWFLDVVIAILFFTTALVLFFKYTPNLYDKGDPEELLIDARSLSEKLLSPGYPVDWETLDLSDEYNRTRIVYFGIINVNNTRVNNEKLNSLIDLINNDYPFVKEKQGLRFDFFVQIIEPENNTILESFGRDYSSANDIIRIERFVVLNNSITKLNIFVFKD